MRLQSHWDGEPEDGEDLREAAALALSPATLPKMGSVYDLTNNPG